MSDQVFQQGSVGVIVTAIAHGVIALIGLIPRSLVPVAVVRGLAADVSLLYYWGRGYMRQHWFADHRQTISICEVSCQ